MTDGAAAISPDELPGDARAIYDWFQSRGMNPAIEELRFMDGKTIRVVVNHNGFPTSRDGDLLIPAKWVWNCLMTEDLARQFLAKEFPELDTEKKRVALLRKPWGLLKADGLLMFYTRLCSFLQRAYEYDPAFDKDGTGPFGPSPAPSSSGIKLEAP
jgi:hypothetical protein